MGDCRVEIVPRFTSATLGSHRLFKIWVIVAAAAVIISSHSSESHRLFKIWVIVACVDQTYPASSWL